MTVRAVESRPTMQLLLVIFSALAVSSTPTFVPSQILHARDNVPYPGPIPYAAQGHSLPNQQSVNSNDKHDGLATSTDIMTDCLSDFGYGQFYDSWDGSYCGGYGWFKGPPDSKISTYDCYQTCAAYIIAMGIYAGSKDYQCDFRTGISGHCWMGYHPADAPTTNATGQVETS